MTLQAGRIISPRTDYVTASGAAGFSYHLDSAVLTALDGPKKELLGLWIAVPGDQTASFWETATLINEGKNKLRGVNCMMFSLYLGF